MLMGRHCPSGPSLALLACRALKSSRAQARYGRPSLNRAAIFTNSEGSTTCPPKDETVPSAAPASHSPERSGLPSAVRGVGAARLGWPLGSLGTLAVG